MNFFAHPGHDHSKMLAEQRSLDTTTIIILAIAGIAIVGIVIALIIANRSQKKKAPAK